MRDRMTRALLTIVAVLLSLNLAWWHQSSVAAQSGSQYKAVMFDQKNFVDQSERIADICNSESRSGWQFVSMGTVVSTTYLVFRR